MNVSVYGNLGAVNKLTEPDKETDTSTKLLNVRMMAALMYCMLDEIVEGEIAFLVQRLLHKLYSSWLETIL